MRKLSGTSGFRLLCLLALLPLGVLHAQEEDPLPTAPSAPVQERITVDQLEASWPEAAEVRTLREEIAARAPQDTRSDLHIRLLEIINPAPTMKVHVIYARELALLCFTVSDHEAFKGLPECLPQAEEQLRSAAMMGDLSALVLALERWPVERSANDVFIGYLLGGVGLEALRDPAIVFDKETKEDYRTRIEASMKPILERLELGFFELTEEQRVAARMEIAQHTMRAVGELLPQFRAFDAERRLHNWAW